MARGRKPTFPTEIYDLQNISIAKFSNAGYLKPNRLITGSINYKHSELHFMLRMYENEGVLSIDFGNYRQNIPLISRKSNLGTGLIWFFKCLKTKQVGRKLYFYEGKFIHQKGIPYNYTAQNLGKNWRFIRQLFRREQGLDIPPFKREYYAGKPTKNYLRFLKAIEKAEVSNEEMKKFINILKF